MASPVAALSNLAVKLGDLALQEANYLDGVGEKLTRLRTELIWMKCFLNDAAAGRGSRKEVVGAWVAEVRELAYEAEDIIDTFDIKISSKRRSCILKEDWWLHKMGTKMDELTEKIAVLTRRAQTYGIQPAADDGESSARRMPRQETFPNEIEKDVVGFDDYTNSLVSVLQDKRRERYKVVVIAGMGGLGKTTLAKKVFHHREIGGYFEQFTWVYVSQQYRRSHVWQQILLGLECPTVERRPETRTRLIGDNTKRNEILNSTDRGEQGRIQKLRKLNSTDRGEQERIQKLRKEILNFTDQDLQGRIKEKLQKKKCLVVLDDVWENEDWDDLRAAFPVDQQSNLSKILITSRLETVAQGARPFFLTPACLNPDKSWELLQKIVFPSRREDAEIANEMDDPNMAFPQEDAEMSNEKDDPNMALAQQVEGRTSETKDLQRTLAQEEITNEMDPPKMGLTQEGAEEKTNKMDAPEMVTLQERAAGRTAEAEDSKRKLAHEMVEHCGGLPLAIRVLGGLLTASSTEWSTIQKNIKSLIARGGNRGQDNKGVTGILATSYEDLPAQLKSCFIYMAQFPEDYEISVDKLEKMWIAEGMVEPVQVHWEEGQEELEDVAKSYLNQLIQRSMVLVGMRGVNNELETCRLHDLMRDVCLSKAKEENMLQILNQTVKNDKSGAHSMSKIGNVRRLAIHELDILYPNPHLRSLWFFSDILPSTEYEADLEGFFQLLAGIWKFFWSSRQFLLFVTNKYKLLRVLDLDGVVLPSITLPSEIGELIYLKMLTFGEISVIKLPSSLGKLRCLQTLVLENATVCWLSNVVRKLEQLRHLYLPLDCEVWKFKIGRWRNLRTLRNFRFQQSGEAESLGELTQLRELTVAITQYLLEAFSRALVKLRNLRSLSMRIRGPYGDLDQSIDITPILKALKERCPNVYKLELSGDSFRQYRITFPEDAQLFPATITHLALSRWISNEILISKLGEFPNLRFLTLTYLDEGRQLRCTQGFHQLVFLALHSLYLLEEFIIDKEAMPRLERMEITYCSKLKSVPEGLRFIESLQELKIIGMPKEFNDRLVPGGADYEEVKDIPSVLLIDPFEEPAELDP